MAVLDFTLEILSQMSLPIQSTTTILMSECGNFCLLIWYTLYIVCDLIIMLLSSEIPPAERITSATQANNANKEPHTTTEQIEISEYRHSVQAQQVRSCLMFLEFIGNHDEEKNKRNKVNWDQGKIIFNILSSPLFQIQYPKRSIKINWNWIIGTKDQRQLVGSCQTNFPLVTQFNFFCHFSDDRVGSGRSRDRDQVRDNSRDSQENFNNNRRTFQSGELWSKLGISIQHFVLFLFRF